MSLALSCFVFFSPPPPNPTYLLAPFEEWLMPNLGLRIGNKLLAFKLQLKYPDGEGSPFQFFIST
ncbi:hypothetical protein ACU8KH_02639 [Lachancea thermotolerans]